MKLPFHIILAPLLKPNLGRTRLFCQHPTFAMSVFYTYLYGFIGFLVNAHQFGKNLGVTPFNATCSGLEQHNVMLFHDLKIVATSMGMVQYACLIVGCLTQNPSLFLPHLFGQLIIVIVKVLNFLALLATMKFNKSKLLHRIPTIMLLMFNWLQEFCVFRQFLCVCDL